MNEARRLIFQPPDDKAFPEHYVTGVSDAVQLLHKELAAAGRGDFPVLLLGETGVGEEHPARLIHALAKRDWGGRERTRLNSRHSSVYRMASSA